MTAANGLARRLRRHWALAVVGALFLLAGALALDDYGVGNDERNQRAIGIATLDYLAGEGERAFEPLVRQFYAHDRYYGAAFEAPLALIERIPGLEDSRDVHLGRHFLTHLFFLVGGVFCYLLVLRLFGSRPLALLAMVLFLLHPRIYAHSFFNSKDVPFLAMFMIALYLTHRAFRRDTLGAFLLCGAGVGLLANLRVMGIALFAVVLALRALDLLTAGNRGVRQRVLRTGAGFALIAILTYYASLPALWIAPVARFAEMLGMLGSHSTVAWNLFRGEWLYSPNGPPLAYVPVWVGITTPPATLLLALIGTVALAWRALRRPRGAVRDGPTRFGLLLVALPVATTVAVVVLETNLYNGWRQLYFLYAPLLLLAIMGLREFVRAPWGRWGNAGAYALAGAALAVTVVSMFRIHPLQHSYFSLLTDRATPEGLAFRYDTDYWEIASRGILTGIVGEHPSGRLFVASPHVLAQRGLLPPDERGRITTAREFRSGEAGFYDLWNHDPARNCPATGPSGVFVASVYGTTLQCLVDPVDWFGALRREALTSAPLVRSRFDAHRVGGFLVYLRDSCARDDLGARVFLHVHPVDSADLPEYLPGFPPASRAAHGFEKRDFRFGEYGTRIDGDCVAAMPLPVYPIAHIETGQYTPAWAEAARRAVADAEPLARARFDIHREGGTLTYVRDGCSAEDAEARFFLHVFPEDAASLPAHRHEHGFDNLNFSLREYGVRTDGGICVAAVPLLPYPIARVETGQFTAGGSLWEAAFALPR